MKRNIHSLIILVVVCFVTSAFSQNTIHVNYSPTSKPVYYNTGTHIVVADMRDFLSEYELVVTNTTYWDPEKQVEYKEDGKPYRNELNYLLDSLSLTRDSIFLNEKLRMPHHDLRNDKMDYLTQQDEFDSAIMALLKKGTVRIIDLSDKREVHIISVKKVKYKDHLKVRSANWVVREKATQKQIFEKNIFVKMHDAF